MAEILLAKVFGPAGFEQAVVIKRVLPHLMRQESFASMFVDEALIAARIHHPNVVRVHELGNEGEELFLVMEYLEGENLHGLMRRLASRGERLSLGLCAHVVSAACAGLHAAHEMRDPDGNPQDLVHRDVSPQNVFVTYGGGVKLLDFGVAKAADRITRTEAGQVKGKYAYMSPEQVDGRPLDRRSDLFSLGTVLYELSTGRRLFQRATEMLTMRAITERPIRPPSEVAEGYPPALEAVVMRALARDPAARYQTAGEMRHDLLAAQREMASELAPDEALAARMQELFPDRIEEKQELLRRLRAGSDVTDLPSPEVDIDIEIPSVVGDADEEPAPATVPDLPPRPARAGRGAILLASAGAIAIAAGGALYYASTLREGEVAIRMVGPVPQPPPPVAAGHPGDAGTGDTVTVRVETVPPGAVVLVDGERHGTSPLSIEVVRSERPVVVEARRAGRRPAARRLVPEEDADVVLHLSRRGREATPRRTDEADAPPGTSRIKRFP